jgi:mono/diheme cytochrome c family protein
MDDAMQPIRTGAWQQGAARLLLVVAMSSFIASTRADDFDLGRTQYLSSCAGCHGDDAKGNGPLRIKLQTTPPGLTTLAKRNQGVFPVSTVYQVIDGRALSEERRAREMPIWGCRHVIPSIAPSVPPNRKIKPRRPKTNVYESHLDLGCDSEDVIANRILSIIEYLRSIQEN